MADFILVCLDGTSVAQLLGSLVTCSWLWGEKGITIPLCTSYSTITATTRCFKKVKEDNTNQAQGNSSTNTS